MRDTEKRNPGPISSKSRVHVGAGEGQRGNSLKQPIDLFWAAGLVTKPYRRSPNRREWQRRPVLQALGAMRPSKCDVCRTAASQVAGENGNKFSLGIGSKTHSRVE